MKVALITTRTEARQSMPIPLLILAACIEDICEVRVFDPEPYDKALWDVIKYKPDIVGVTATSQGYWRAKEIIEMLKVACPAAKFIIGGIHASVMPEQVLKETGVDCVCVGEGENVLKSFVIGERSKAVFDIDVLQLRGIVGPYPLIKDIDTLPMPAYHLMPDAHKYLKPPGTIRGKINKNGGVVILTSRGCPGKCIFCAADAVHGKRVRRRSVDNVMKEIKYVRELYGDVNYSMMDDTFTIYPSWVKEFCRQIKPLKVDWQCQTRADGLTLEIAQLMKDSGCVQVDIGVESGSNKVLKTLKKGITRLQLLETFTTARRVGLRTGATFVLGTPGETETDIDITKIFIKYAKPDICFFFYLHPYPGTELYDRCPDDSYTNGTGYQDIPLKTNSLISTERYVEIRNELFNMVKWHNLYGYLNWESIIFGLSILSFKGLIIFFVTWYRRRNMYDGLYAFLQNYRSTG